MDALVKIFGIGPDLTVAHMTARAFVVFWLMLLAVRIAGRRSLGGISAFDFILSVLIGAVASRAITGNSPFLPTMAAVYALVLTHRVIGWLCVLWPALDLALNGRERVLANDGVPRGREMRRALVTKLDLEEAARLGGHASPANAGQMTLERNGTISTVPKRPR